MFLVGVPGVLHEGSETRGERLRKKPFAGLVEGNRQEKRAGIVVEAIAMRAIRHGMDGVLEKPISRSELAAALERWIGPPLLG